MTFTVELTIHTKSHADHNVFFSLFICSHVYKLIIIKTVKQQMKLTLAIKIMIPGYGVI